MPDAYYLCMNEEAQMKPLEIDCTKPLELPQKPESHFGIVVMLASFAAAASVCSAMLTIVTAG
jgi:hypothetical protein